MAVTAATGSMVKSSRRGKVAQLVWVSRAYSGYIEYVGAKRSARAARAAEGHQHVQHHLVAAVGRPHLVGGETVSEVGARGRPAERSRPAPDSGSCVLAAVATAAAISAATRSLGGYGFSLTFRQYGTSSCGAPYGTSPTSSGRTGRLVTGRSCAANRRVTAAPWDGRSSDSANTSTCRATSRSAASVVVDHVHGLEEALHVQPRGVAGAAGGGQHVGAAGAVVAQRHR